MKRDKRGYKKQFFYFFCCLTIAILSAIIYTCDVSASSYASSAECVQKAKNKYSGISTPNGNVYDDNWETFEYRCYHNYWDNGSKYGTIVMDSRSYPELTGPSNVSFVVRRVIIGMGGQSQSATRTCVKPTTSGVTVDPNSIGGATLGSGRYVWSEWDGGTATVNISSLSNTNPTNVSGGLYKGEINFTSTLNCSSDADSTAAGVMYYKFYKVSRINHTTPTTSISTDENNPTFVSDGDTITFTHKLNRNDSWESSASFDNVYKIGSGSWSNLSFGASGAWKEVTDTKRVSDLGLTLGETTKVCSTLTHYKYRGYGGHTPNDTSTETSEVCGYVRKDRIITASNLGYSSATTSVGHTTYDVTNPSLVVDGDGSTNSVESEGGILVEDYSIEFLHKVATVNGEGNSVPLNYRIEQKVDGGSWVNISNGDKSITRTHANGWLIVRNATGNQAEKFKLTFGASKTICERLIVWDTSIVYDDNGTHLKSSSGTGTSTVCAKIKRKTPQSTERVTSLKSSVDANGVIVSNTQNGEGNKASYEGGPLMANYNVNFSHYLKFPAPSSPYSYGNQEFTYTIERKTDDGAYSVVSGEQNLTSTVSSDGSYHLLRYNGDINTNIPNFDQTVTICERITAKPRSITFYEQNAKPAAPDNSTVSSEVCAVFHRRKPTSTERTTGLKSSVNIGGNTASNTQNGEGNIATYEGNSRIANYNVDFGHYLKFPAPESPYSYSNQDFTYTIERKINNGSYTAVSGEQDLTSSISANGNYHLLQFNGSVGVNFPSFDPHNLMEQTITICERVTAKPKSITFFELNAKPAAPNNGTVSSEVCATIHRPKPTTKEITAVTSADIDGLNAVHDETYYSINKNRQLIFYHKFAHNYGEGKTLNTDYTIEYVINSRSGTKTGSISTPRLQSHVYNLELDYDEVYRICEHVFFSPSIYYLHTDNTIEPVDSIGESNWMCVNVGRPGLRMIDDGDITIYSSSSASIDMSTVGGYSSEHDAYLISGDEATINYTHKLWRNQEKHTGDWVHQAEAISPEDDVTDLRYLFADPGRNISESSFNNLPDTTIATNSSKTFHSDTENPAYSENTKITTSKLGEKVTKCQSIFYNSSKYILRGQYWMLGDVIFSGYPFIQLREHPVRNPKPTSGSNGGTIGKSEKACISIIRPYNFKIDTITATNDVKPSIQGSNMNPSFSVNVVKNSDTFYITDIKDAVTQIIGFTINTADSRIRGIIGTSDGVAGNTDSSVDACTHFTNKLGLSNCNVLSEYTRNFGATQNPTGDTFYKNTNSSVCHNGQCSYKATFKSPNEILIPDNLDLKEKYCVAVAIKPANSGTGFVGGFSNHWSISNASCANIGKWPNTQVWGGSTATNGGVKTSVTAFGGKTFGSWDDFTIIANKPITNMASGATFISGLENATVCKYSPLTIANRECSSNRIGEADIYSGNEFINKLYTRFINGGEGITQINEIAPGQITGGNSSMIIYSGTTNKNIYIIGDIKSSSNPYTSNNVPQIIIYAEGNIYIDPAVETIDAWLIAKGRINTCADGSGNTKRIGSDATTCSKKLEITGPVYGEKIILDRTAGADLHAGTIKEAAEIIDLTPASVLFGENQASRGAQPMTTYLHKLPPRY